MEGRGLRVAGEGARVVADIVCSYRTVDGEEREVDRREGVGMKLGIYTVKLPCPCNYVANSLHRGGGGAALTGSRGDSGRDERGRGLQVGVSPSRDGKAP